MGACEGLPPRHLIDPLQRSANPHRVACRDAPEGRLCASAAIICRTRIEAWERRISLASCIRAVKRWVKSTNLCA
jgi:hypothetical protein